MQNWNSNIGNGDPRSSRFRRTERRATTLNLSAGTSITHGRASWGSSTVALSNDPMTDIKWPGKLDAAAKQTLENARAAGRRFIKAKYDLRNKVLSAYYDYALNAELIRLEQSNQQLLDTTATVTEAQNRAGSSGQEDVLKADNEVDMSGNNIANMESQLPSQRAAINCAPESCSRCSIAHADRTAPTADHWRTRMVNWSSWPRNRIRN